MKERYFVIGGNANRTRHNTVKSGIAHAADILAGKAQLEAGYVKPGKTVLYVVKLVRVVEIAPPPVLVRTPSEQD